MAVCIPAARTADQPPDGQQNPTVTYIQRSVQTMEDGTEPVRILFYGQSITAGKWRQVTEALRQKFPKAKLEVECKAIGGFHASLLEGTAHSDLYPFYPDLLIFHVYGNIKSYEEIIARTRALTTAEIILTTDHVSNDTRNEKADERVGQLAEIARKYRCTLIDVRSKWKAHLEETGLPARHFLRDNVHPNDAGNELYVRFMLEEIVRLYREEEDAGFSSQIRTFSSDAEEVRTHPDGEVEFSFKGNRVVVVSGGKSGPVEITVDGKTPGQWKGNWVHSRVSPPPEVHDAPRPAITHVGFDALPVAEKWTLTALPGSKADGSQIRFKVEGSITGQDGEGVSTKPFRSQSGRVTIQPQAWFVADQLRRSKVELSENFQLHWTASSIIPDRVELGEQGTRVVVVQGLPNDQHTLRLKPVSNDTPLPLAGFVVGRANIFL